MSSDSLIERALEAGRMCCDLLLQQGGAAATELAEEELPLIQKALASVRQHQAEAEKAGYIRGFRYAKAYYRGDASARKDEAAQALLSSSASGSCSEMPVVDHRKEFESHPQFRYLDFDRDRDAWDRGKYKHSHVQALFEGFAAGRAMEPVSVSLDHTAKGYWMHLQKIDDGSLYDTLLEESKEHYRSVCKVILDAAGVKYGE